MNDFEWMGSLAEDWKDLEFPVNFNYGGLTAKDFIKQNGISYSMSEEATYTLHKLVSESETLRMTLSCKAFKNYPTLEYHLTFDNPSNAASEQLSGVRSLKMQHMPKGPGRVLRHHGAFHMENETYTWRTFRDSFTPVNWEPSRVDKISFGGIDGRNSVDWMPYFDIPDGENNLRVAIGWAGQWNCNIAWDLKNFSVDAGIESFDAYLEPGEHLDFPSIIIQRTTNGGREKAVNIWRRFVTDEIIPKRDGKPVTAPLSSMTWGGRKEAEQLAKISDIKANGLPFELYWIDAGWFGPESINEHGDGWAGYVGDWAFNPETYPDEARNISAASHEAGMKIILWTEQERVVRTSKLAKEHPEYLIDIGNNNLLLDLGDKAAWQHCYDTIVRIIRDNDIDWYRVDFNFSPLPYWQKKDTDRRKGITEVKYINGLYRFWRSLTEEFPNITVENCASGGRRLDFELFRYGLTLWCSDLECWTDFETKYSLTQISGMADYWPRFSFGTQNQEGGDTYNFRAAISNGLAVHYNYTSLFKSDNYPVEWLKERLEEFHKLRDYYCGDFYELAPPTQEEYSWVVMQYDLPEEGRGLISAFRGTDCPETTRIIKPRGLSSEKDYLVSDIDNSFEPFRISGAKLMQEGFELCMAQPRTARMITYSIA